MSLYNIRSLVQRAEPLVRSAWRDAGVMHLVVTERVGPKKIRLADDRLATEFVDCSFLGLQAHPRVVDAAIDAIREWGVHLTTSRARLTIRPIAELEQRLGILWNAKAIVFPSVTSAHSSVLPLLAAGELFRGTALADKPIHLIFDRFAHASMKNLKPVLATICGISTTEHNDLEELRLKVAKCVADGMVPVYLADSIYSMGTTAPLSQLFKLVEEFPTLALYLDDAHGTAIHGERGEGFVLATLNRPLPWNIFVAFSLAKGFGCNGGGVLFANEEAANCVRMFGATFNFSAPIDFSAAGAALEVTKLIEAGYIRPLQASLRKNIHTFDSLLRLPADDISPIRMIRIGDERACIAAARALLDCGFLVSASMFPVVPEREAQLRICISAAHSSNDLSGLVDSLRSSRAIK